jgi:hypothetical protein
VTPPPAAVVAPKPKPKPKPKHKVKVYKVKKKATVPTLTAPTTTPDRGSMGAVPAATRDLTPGDGSSKNWFLILLVIAAGAILAVAATPVTVFPQSVADVVASRRLEITFAGLALVAGVGLSMLLAAVLS